MNKEISLEWLRDSYANLIVIEEIIHIEYLSHMVAFHAHQSIEKSFKAILKFHSKNMPIKHDLVHLKYLVSEYIEIDNMDILEDLNILYRDSRYPTRFRKLLKSNKPTLKNAKEFHLFSNNIFDRVCRVLNVSIYEITDHSYRGRNEN